MTIYIFNDKISVTADSLVNALSELLRNYAEITINSLVVNNNQISADLLTKLNSELEKFRINPILIKGFVNFGGFSCFADSVLFPILLVDSPLKVKLLTTNSEIKEVLNELYSKIIGSKESSTCSTLFQKLKKTKFNQELLTGDQQDDSEFLVALLDFLNYEPSRVRKIRKQSSDSSTWFLSSNVTTNEAVLEINLQDTAENILTTFQSDNIQDWVESDISEYPRTAEIEGGPEIPHRFSMEKNIIESSETLIFHTVRKLFNKKNRTPVKFSRLIKNTSTGKDYKLSIITVHHGISSGGHYISYFLFNGDWYLYDDLDGIKLVDYSEVVKDAETNSSLFFYFPQ